MQARCCLTNTNYALQIRKRRLEKLGGSVASKKEKPEGAEDSSTASSPAVKSVTETPVTKTPTSTTSTPSSSSTPNPFASLNQRSVTSSSPSNTSVRPQSPNSSLKRPRTESQYQTPLRVPPQPQKASAPATPQSLPEWEDHTLQGIFRVTIVEGRRTDASGHKLVDLPGQRQELQDEGLPLLLSKDRLDGIILEAASLISHNKSILDYLLPCWKRIHKAQKSSKGHAGEKDTILKEAQRLCMSYMIFAVEVPDLFGYVRCAIVPTSH